MVENAHQVFFNFIIISAQQPKQHAGHDLQDLRAERNDQRGARAENDPAPHVPAVDVRAEEV